MKRSSKKHELAQPRFCRLSRDDNMDSESNSIQNQRKILQKAAKDKGYSDTILFIDNGYPKTKNVLAKIEKECVEKLQKLKEECGGLKPEKVRPEMTFGDWLTY